MRRVIIESPYAPKLAKPTRTPEEVQAACSCVFEPEYTPCESCRIDEHDWDAWYEELNRNEQYARAAMRDCLLRGEAPYASHLLYTQQGVLDDTLPEQRKLGMEAGFAYRDAVDASIVYTDLGISKGMQMGIEDANAKGRAVEYRSLPEWTR